MPTLTGFIGSACLPLFLTFICAHEYSFTFSPLDNISAWNWIWMSRSQVPTRWMCVYTKTQPLNLLRPGFLRCPWDLMVIKPFRIPHSSQLQKYNLSIKLQLVFPAINVIIPSTSGISLEITKKFFLAEISYWLNNT